MAKITVRLHGEEVGRLTLESGIEYIAGRAQDAQIVLNSERGISRHHLKFVERNGVWVCESLSKFVLIQKGGQSVEVVELDGPTSFMVPPYEFTFEPKNHEAEASGDKAKASENLPVFYQPRTGQASDPMDTSPRANEATMAGASTLVPYFRVSYPNTADDEVLKLEGHLWTAGRDSANEIAIDSPHISRKHFELARTKEGFFITDLGSSNGTKINGQKIPPHEPTRIDSGDEIRVMNITMSFEIRDSHFSNRIENLPVQAFDPFLAAPPVPWQHDLADDPTDMKPVSENLPATWREYRPHHLKKVDWKKNRVRIAIVALIPVGIYLGMMPDKPKGMREPNAVNSGKQSVVYENLTVEQKAVVKDSFNLARSLYVQGKYELCLTELAKVHERIPQYDNSKELQSFCEQGRELVHRQRDLERKERERAMIEQQIASFVETCKAKLTVTAGVDETRLCLSDAVELDPQHHLITEMIQGAQMREDERKFMAEEKAKRDAKAAQGVAQYRKAKALWKKGRLYKAVHEYERFIAAPFPDIEDEKNVARREIASIRQELKTKVDTFLEQCQSLGAKNKYRDAYMACDQAVEEDPDNELAKDTRKQMHSELKREMKNIYEDSVLEESLGNVDSAKEKWKKIIKENLKFDDYTKKAKSKLQKYGVGL